MIRRRVGEIAALLLISDGVVGVLQPERHTRLWRSGPGMYRRPCSRSSGTRPDEARGDGRSGHRILVGTQAAPRNKRCRAPRRSTSSRAGSAPSPPESWGDGDLPIFIDG